MQLNFHSYSLLEYEQMLSKVLVHICDYEYCLYLIEMAIVECHRLISLTCQTVESVDYLTFDVVVVVVAPFAVQQSLLE